jgi:hypothetical protein
MKITEDIRDYADKPEASEAGIAEKSVESGSGGAGERGVYASDGCRRALR